MNRERQDIRKTRKKMIKKKNEIHDKIHTSESPNISCYKNEKKNDKYRLKNRLLRPIVRYHTP